MGLRKERKPRLRPPLVVGWVIGASLSPLGIAEVNKTVF